MFPIKCPQCGLVNEPDDVSFPRCSGCNEELVACASCRHYVDMHCEDPAGERLFSPDRNVAQKCPSFHSRDEVRGSRWLRALPAPVWVAITLLLLVIGITAVIWVIDPDGQLWSGREQLSIDVTVPAQMQLGVLNTVEILIKNPTHNRVSRWYLELDGSLCSNTAAEMSMPLPEPTTLKRNSEGTNYQLEFPPVKDWKQVRLYFRPKRLGEQTLIIKLYTSGLARGRVVNARTIVVKTRGTANVPKEGRVHER